MSDDIEEAQRLAELLGFPSGPDAGFYIKLFEMLLDMKARLEKLEGKLSKAVRALDRIAGKVPYADDPYDIARSALAELKGDKP